MTVLYLCASKLSLFRYLLTRYPSLHKRLGFIITMDGYALGPATVAEGPAFKNITEVRKFLGLAELHYKELPESSHPDQADRERCSLRMDRQLLAFEWTDNC